VAAVRAVLTYISTLVGVLRKMVTSVHGHEQDKEHLFMYTCTCVCVCVFFVLYCRFKAHNERMDKLVKEIVTEPQTKYRIGP
jgi:Na+/melibiose symporter-like transporter